MNFNSKTKRFQWKLMIKMQGFIQALLSTAVFSQRFSFFMVCLSLLSPWGASMVSMKGKIFWSLGLQIAGNSISDTFWLSDITCTSFFCSGSNFSWHFRISWGVLWDWISKLNSKLSFYYCLPVVEKSLENCLKWYIWVGGYRGTKVQSDCFFHWWVIWVQSWENLACCWQKAILANF